MKAPHEAPSAAPASDNEALRLERLRQRTATVRYRPRVVCLNSVSPLTVLGGRMLDWVELAGGRFEAPSPGAASQEWSLDRLVEASPEVLILFSSDGAALGASLGQPGWNLIPAVRYGRVYSVEARGLIDLEATPSAAGAEVLAALVQPGRCGSLLPEGVARRIEGCTSSPSTS